MGKLNKNKNDYYTVSTEFTVWFMKILFQIMLRFKCLDQLKEH